MQKTDLVNLIKKYYLDGTTFQENSSGFNPVLYSIQGKSCQIKIKSGDKSLMVMLDHNLELEDCDLVIPESKNLLTYLSAFDNEIELTPEKSGLDYTSLKISDKSLNGKLALGSVDVVERDTNVNLPTDYDVVIELTRDEIDRFLKAKKGIGDAKIVAFIPNEDTVNVVINYSVQNHNVDTITTQFSKVTVNNEFEVMAFKVDVLNAILQNNSDFREGKIELLGQGLMVVEFRGEDYEVKYLLKPIAID